MRQHFRGNPREISQPLSHTQLGTVERLRLITAHVQSRCLFSPNSMSDPVCCRSRDDNADGLDLGVTSPVKAEGDSLETLSLTDIILAAMNDLGLALGISYRLIFHSDIQY